VRQVESGPKTAAGDAGPNAAADAVLLLSLGSVRFGRCGYLRQAACDLAGEDRRGDGGVSARQRCGERGRHHC